MDELSYALGIDPIELRRRNDTQVEPIKQLPYTSRSLMACFDAGSKAFGWSARNPKPGATRDGDWLVGLGCATTMYPTQVAPASARVSLSPQGAVKVQCATHEIGNGVRTVLASPRRPAGRAPDQVTSRWATATCRRRRSPAAPTPPPAAATWSPRRAARSWPHRAGRGAGQRRAFRRPRSRLACAWWRAAHRRGRQGRAAGRGDGAGRRRRDRGLRRERAARRSARRRAGALQGQGGAGRRRQDEGPHPVRVRRPVHRGARARADRRGAHATRGRRVRGRDHRQPAHRQEPADGRHDLGHLGSAARGDRDRCGGRPLLQRRPLRVPGPGQRRHRRNAGDHASRGQTGM